MVSPKSKMDIQCPCSPCGAAYVFIIGRRKDALDAAVVQIGKNVTGVRGDVANLAVSAPFISLPSSTPIEIPMHL